MTWWENDQICRGKNLISSNKLGGSASVWVSSMVFFEFFILFLIGLIVIVANQFLFSQFYFLLWNLLLYLLKFGSIFMSSKTLLVLLKKYLFTSVEKFVIYIENEFKNFTMMNFTL